MDESRKQFAEAFEELTGWELEDYPNQDYAETCWEFWKKSRESIEIQLPRCAGWNCDPYNSGLNDGVHGSAKAIRAAGIKVKE